MPALSNEQIHEKIVSGAITAVSVDTTDFDRYGCNLRHPVLAALEYFPANGIDLLISEVIKSEVLAHIVKDLGEKQGKALKALREQAHRWHFDLTDETKKMLQIDVDPAAFALAEWEALQNRVKLDVVEINDEMNLTQELVRRYFSSLPPFETKETKKHEFPDAIALMSLEFHVEDQGGLLLAVSNDHGWKLFAAQSDHVIVVNDIKTALSLFHKAGEPVAEAMVDVWFEESEGYLATKAFNALETWVQELSFEIEGDGPTYFSTDSEEAVLQYISEFGKPKVLAFGGKQITFSISLDLEVTFYADFSFYVEDRIDGDEVLIGSQSADRTERVTVEVTVSAQYEDGPQDVTNVEFTITGKPVTAYFGYVDPFDGENPTHEKY